MLCIVGSELVHKNNLKAIKNFLFRVLNKVYSEIRLCLTKPDI